MRTTRLLIGAALLAACERTPLRAPASGPAPAAAAPLPAPAQPAPSAAPAAAAEPDPDPELPPRAKQSTPADEEGADAVIHEFEGAPVERIATAWPDGGRKRIAYVKRDRRGRAIDHGPDWRWFENHQICLKRVWKDGKQDGPFEEWHEGGFEKAR